MKFPRNSQNILGTSLLPKVLKKLKEQPALPYFCGFKKELAGFPSRQVPGFSRFCFYHIEVI